MNDKVGKFFTINGNDVWKLISFCPEPSLCFENLETKERCGGAVSSPNVSRFIELKPVKDAKDE